MAQRPHSQTVEAAKRLKATKGLYTIGTDDLLVGFELVMLK